MHRLKKTNKKILITLLLFVLLIPSYFISSNLLSKIQEKQSTAKTKELLEKCKNLSYKERCYADSLYDLTKQKNIPFSKLVLNKLQKMDPYNSTGCHFMAHRISQAEVEKDPKNWERSLKEVSPYECTGGYIHGIIETYLSSIKNLTLDALTMDKVCNAAVEGNDGYAMRSCYHILGHITLAETQNSFPDSIKTCKSLDDYYHQYECLSGVFMENLTRENLIAHGLEKPMAWDEENTKKVEELCQSMEGLESQACWKEISYLYITISNESSQGLYDLCQRAPNVKSREECYIYGVGNMVHFSTFKKENLSKICDPVLNNKVQFNNCLNQVVGSLLSSSEQDLVNVLSLCSHYQSYSESCFDYVITTLKYHSASKSEIKEICSQIANEFNPYSCLQN